MYKSLAKKPQKKLEPEEKIKDNYYLPTNTNLDIKRIKNPTKLKIHNFLKSPQAGPNINAKKEKPVSTIS